MEWHWVLWIAAGVGLETYALLTKAEGDTLSERMWDWFSVRGKGKAWQLRRTVLLLGMTWLTAHFITGGAV